MVLYPYLLQMMYMKCYKNLYNRPYKYRSMNHIYQNIYNFLYILCTYCDTYCDTYCYTYCYKYNNLFYLCLCNYDYNCHCMHCWMSSMIWKKTHTKWGEWIKTKNVISLKFA